MVSGVFLDPIVKDLEIKVWLFAAAVSVATGIGGIAAVFIGPLVDRISPKRLILVGAISNPTVQVKITKDITRGFIKLKKAFV